MPRNRKTSSAELLIPIVEANDHGRSIPIAQHQQAQCGEQHLKCVLHFQPPIYEVHMILSMQIISQS